MSDTRTANIARKHVTSHMSAAFLNRSPAELSLNEHDGILWATNRYWITPAARVAPLLEQYNLDAGAPGAFEVNSTVRKRDGSASGIGSIISKPGDYPEPAAPVRLGGQVAHVQLDDRGPWLAVHQTAAGTLLGLAADTLAWLSDAYACGSGTMSAAFGLGDGDRFGAVRIMSRGSGAAPVLLVADVIRTLTPAHYASEGESAYVPAEAENLGPRVIGALMAVSLGGLP